MRGVRFVDCNMCFLNLVSVLKKEPIQTKISIGSHKKTDADYRMKFSMQSVTVQSKNRCRISYWDFSNGFSIKTDTDFHFQLYIYKFSIGS